MQQQRVVGVGGRQADGQRLAAAVDQMVELRPDADALPGPGAEDAPPPFIGRERAPGNDLFGLAERERRAVLTWVGENLTQVRRSAYKQRLLHWSLAIGLVVAWPRMPVATRSSRR